jgi:hypothetical protein
MKKAKELEMTKEFIIPLIRRKERELEQPRLELPLPTILTEIKHDKRNEEETVERGVWTIDI